MSSLVDDGARRLRANRGAMCAPGRDRLHGGVDAARSVVQSERQSSPGLVARGRRSRRCRTRIGSAPIGWGAICSRARSRARACRWRWAWWRAPSACWSASATARSRATSAAAPIMLMMRIIEILSGLPLIFFVIFLTVIFGRSEYLLFLSIGAVGWLTMARIVRGQTLSIRQQEFIEAAVASGAGTARIIVKHVIPNVIGPVIVYATLTVPQIIMFESFLSFLGPGNPGAAREPGHADRRGRGRNGGGALDIAGARRISRGAAAVAEYLRRRTCATRST